MKSEDVKNGVATLENSIKVLQVMKQSCQKMLQFNSYTLRNEDIYLCKIINRNDYSNINYNNQKCKDPSRYSTNAWINKIWDILAIAYYVAIQKEQSIITGNKLDKL